MADYKSNISLGIIGAGSCASSLAQVIYLNKKSGDASCQGVQEPLIGHYRVSDINIVSVIDIDNRKVGKSFSESINSKINAAVKHFELPETGVVIAPGAILDGVKGKLSEVIPHITQEADDKALMELWRTSGTEILICFLPTGSSAAVEFYARLAAQAGIAFINATPELVSNNTEINSLFERSQTPLLGDDIRSHLGATTLHMALLELLASRGIKVKGTYQLNIGGNTDFLNLSDPIRSLSKQVSKKKALSSSLDELDGVYAGPAAYVPYLQDTKVCYLRIEGESILESNISLEVRMQVEDSPNAAGTMLNAVRVAKIALDRKMGGTITDVCPYLFKSPTNPATESECLKAFTQFIKS